MDLDKTVHYKKIINTYALNKYNTYNDIAAADIVGDIYPRYGLWVPENSYNVNESELQENYGNPIVGVSSQHFTFVVEEYSNKISCKVYHTSRERQVGSKYFKVRRYLTFITYNVKTKNFYNGTIERKNKKLIKKRIRVNNFYEHPFSSLYLQIRRHIRDLSNVDIPKGSYTVNGLVQRNLNTLMLTSDRSDDVSSSMMELFLSKVRDSTNIKYGNHGVDWEHKFYLIYLKANGFKYPDNYSEYLNLSIPKGLLKKHINIVSLFMDINQLKGKKIRLILNTVYDLNFDLLCKLFHLMGVDYFNKIDTNVFVNKSPMGIIDLKVEKILEDVSILSSDRARLIKLLNNGLNPSILFDHLKMVNILNVKYTHLFKMKFNNRVEFDNEHYELSELLASYKKGKVTRFYGKNVTHIIEEIIPGIMGVDYYPKVLLTSKDYNDESQRQHNCVRSYIEKPTSLIISLRVGGEDSKERATLEYRFLESGDLNRVQSLGNRNTNLSVAYDTSLEIIDNRISKLYREKKLKIPTLTKEYKGGKVIRRKSILSEYNYPYLIWDNNDDESFYMDDDLNLPF